MKLFLTLLTILGITSLALFSFKAIEGVESENDVREVVLKAYVNGAFNELDAESMENGFHGDFAIFSADGEEIRKYPIAQWLEGVRKRRSNNYDPKDEKNVWKHNLASVDVTGGAAQVKVELFNQGKHVYTDYLSLLKFESGWKIVAKVYHKH